MINRTMGTSEGVITGRPDYRLFDSSTVALAAFIGGPIAGAILIATNYGRLGKTGKAVAAVVIGLVAAAIPVLIKLSWNSLAGSVCFVALGLLFFLCTWQIAQEVQGEAVEEHIARGGRLGRGAAAFFVGIATTVGMAGVMSGVVNEAGRRSVVMVGTDQVVYSGLATKGTAVALGNALKERHVFVDRGATVELEKGFLTKRLSFAVEDGVWNQAGVLSAYEETTRVLAPILGGLPIELRLVDDKGDEEAKSTVGEVEFDNGNVVRYAGMANSEEAEELGGQLESMGYFKEKGANVMLVRHEDEGTVVSFVVADGVWADPSKVNEFEARMREAAPAVGGLPVVMRLVDSRLVVEKEELIEP
jgi:hypothetical protein